MSDLTQARVLRVAAIVAMDDTELAERLAQLEAVAAEAEAPEDDLTEVGWDELHEMRDERDRRHPQPAVDEPNLMALLANALRPLTRHLEQERCGLCRGTGPLAPGRTICANCAHFPLD